MKRSSAGTVTGSIGMILILLGVVWACQKWTSPGHLNAATGTASSAHTSKTKVTPSKSAAKDLSKKSKKTMNEAVPAVALLPSPAEESIPDAPLPMESEELGFPSPVEPSPAFTEAESFQPQPISDEMDLLSESVSEFADEEIPAPMEESDFSTEELSDAVAIPYSDVSENSADRPAPLATNQNLLSHTAPETSLPVTAPTVLHGSAQPGQAALEGIQRADVAIQKILPPEIQLGTEAVVKIGVKNMGKASAQDVRLCDYLPAGAAFVESSPSLEADPTESGEMVWPLFDLAPGEEKIFEYRIIPEQEGEMGSVASISFVTEASGKTKCTRPQLKMELHAPEETLIGENVKFEISISNPGSGTATNVTLAEEVPEGLEHASGRSLNNVVGDLKPGETKRLSLTLKAVAPGVVANTVSVTADSELRDEKTAEVKINAPELALEISGAKNRYLQREAIYHLKVWNPGSAPARSVRLVAELPKGMDFVRTNNEGVYQEATHSVYWELVELPENISPGEIELVLSPTTVGSGKLVFRGEGEHQLTASEEQEVVIDGMASLSYRVAMLTDSVEAGENAACEIKLTNRGTKDSTNNQLKITLPENTEMVAADGPTRYSPQADGVLFLPLNRIKPKEEVTYKVQFRCNEPGDQRVRVEVGSNEMSPLAKEESVRVY